MKGLTGGNIFQTGNSIFSLGANQIKIIAFAVDVSADVSKLELEAKNTGQWSSQVSSVVQETLPAVTSTKELMCL